MPKGGRGKFRQSLSTRREEAKARRLEHLARDAIAIGVPKFRLSGDGAQQLVEARIIAGAAPGYTHTANAIDGRKVIEFPQSRAEGRALSRGGIGIASGPTRFGAGGLLYRTAGDIARR